MKWCRDYSACILLPIDTRHFWFKLQLCSFNQFLLSVTSWLNSDDARSTFTLINSNCRMLIKVLILVTGTAFSTKQCLGRRTYYTKYTLCYCPLRWSIFGLCFESAYGSVGFVEESHRQNTLK